MSDWNLRGVLATILTLDQKLDSLDVRIHEVGKHVVDHTARIVRLEEAEKGLLSRVEVT